MSDGSSSSSSQRTSTVNLVRSSHPWTEADSAAGFVLRYLTPMRRQLIAVVGSEEQADEALKRLLAHLVAAGFGEYKQGRLRDFLVRALRSAAKTRASELPEERQAEVQWERLTSDSTEWLKYWREGLLERAWRSLERKEHSEPEIPVYSVLHMATTNRDATPAMLAVQINTEFGLKLDETAVKQTLPEARTLFAQLVADEVAETLEAPEVDDVKREIAQLGLGKAFTGLTV